MMSTRLTHVGTGIVLLASAALARADGPGVVEQIKKALAGTKISLAQAIETAQKEAPDDPVVDAELKWNRAPVYFEAELLAGRTLKEVRIDPVTGKLLGVKDQELDASWVAAALADVRQALAGAKLTALQAIARAAKEVPDGQPIAIELKGEPGRFVFGVKLLQGDQLRVAKIDIVKGEVLDIVEEPLPLALWTFDAAESGKTPADLRAKETHPGPKPGVWQVAADPTAPSRPSVLTLTTDEPKATFNVALFEQTAYKDLDLRVRIKANSGQVDQAGGLAWRAKDENNYYICRINPLEDNFRVYKVVDGKRSQLQSIELKAETGNWYHVRAVMVGDQITCYVDGKKYLDVKDDTFKDAGLVGLWTKADASSSFDDLAVFAPPAPKQEEKAKGKAQDVVDDDD
jgi:uncharacterized membrane protein YkoI